MYYEPAEMLEIDNFTNVAYLILIIASFLIILTILVGTILRNENEKLLSVVSIARELRIFIKIHFFIILFASIMHL